MTKVLPGTAAAPFYFEGEKIVKHSKLVIIILLVLLALQLAPTSAEGKVTITLQSTNLLLTNRILVNVPVIIVCDPLPNTPVKNSITVNLEQTSGKKTNKGTAFAISLEGLPIFTCDGVTRNLVTMSIFPDTDSGPFHNGTASVSVMADYWTGVSLGGGGFTDILSEGGESGPIAIRLR